MTRDRGFAGNQLNFIGFSHCRTANIQGAVSSKEDRDSLKSTVNTTVDVVLESKLKQAEEECDKLRTKLT